MPQIDPQTVILVGLGALTIASFIWALWPKQPAPRSALSDNSDPNARRVIIGIDVSSSMKHRAAVFVPAWEAFRAEQQQFKSILYRIYFVMGTVHKANEVLLPPSELPTWTVDSFLANLGRGTAINQFLVRACDRAMLWKHAGFQGRITVFLFSDGFPDNEDKARYSEARESIAVAKKAGIKFKLYLYVDRDQARLAEQLAEHLGLSYASQVGTDAEIVILFENRIADAMRDASQVVRLDELTQRSLLGASAAAPSAPGGAKDTDVNAGRDQTLQ